MKKLAGGVNSNCANRISTLTSAPDPDCMRVQAQEPHLQLPSVSHLASLRMTRVETSASCTPSIKLSIKLIFVVSLVFLCY